MGCPGKEYAEPPKVFPVAGQVVFHDGKPLTGGMVEFQSKSDNSLSVTSEIKPDGRFSLVSRLDGQSFTGASEGEYVVTLFPPQSASQAESPHTLPETYTVEPKDNEFTLTFPLAAP
ncbi:MAG: hypothetical protein O2955_11660 [Planctomycetota bacterium]|nr:hypothetical protein [Planctomycetota bacterium]MDA1213167.1 hypothetical protein [Planctomycetota bacterium]